MADPMYLVSQSFIIQCVEDAFRRAQADRSALDSSEYACGLPESADQSTWGSLDSADESTWGYSELGDESDFSEYDSS